MRNVRAVSICVLIAVTCVVLAFTIIALSGPSGASALPPIRKLSQLPSYIEPDLAVTDLHHLQSHNENTNNDKSNNNGTISAQCKPARKPVSRIITIGDVHGCYDALKKLLKKTNFSKKHDQLVFLGDFISKGKQNFEVLEFAIDNGASCVLGNHEVSILEKYALYYGYAAPKYCTDNGTGPPVCTESKTFCKSGASAKYDQELSIAKRLKQRHIDFLTNCSVIIELGPVGYGNKESKKGKKHGMEKAAHTVIDLQQLREEEAALSFPETQKDKLNYTTPIQGIAVHGGLQWHLGLEDQSVEVAVNLRGLYKPDFIKPSFLSRSDVDKSKVKTWSKVWNKKQMELSDWNDRRIVFYGHESSRGLKLREYTRGLDSACVSGSSLSAVVIYGSKSDSRGDITYHNDLVQVDC